MARADSWHFGEGDAITADLTALRLLGGGSAYEAYLAFDEITYAPVVVKMIRPGRVVDELSMGGLRREVEALGTVNHPVVVRGLRHDLLGARPHVVLEQIDGPRLSTLLRHHGPLPAQQYLPLAIDLASALHYLRRVGWTHLDIPSSARHPGRECRATPATSGGWARRSSRPLPATGRSRTATPTHWTSPSDTPS
jgi:serine/threonine protein kinase